MGRPQTSNRKNIMFRKLYDLYQRTLNNRVWWNTTTTEYDPKTGLALAGGQRLVNGIVQDPPQWANSFLYRSPDSNEQTYQLLCFFSVVGVILGVMVYV